MLNLLRIGTGLAVVLAIVSVGLWRDLRAERELTAALQAQITDSANRDHGSVQTQRIDAPPVAAAPAAKNSGGNPAALLPKPAPVIAINSNIQSGFSPERDLMKDPEYRKARLTQLRMSLKRVYTDVGPELGLSEKETEQLFDILAQQQLPSNLTLPIGPDGQPDRQGLEELRRNQEAERRKQEDALAALLGSDRQAKWQDYQQTLSARSRATSMSSMLATSGYPLTEAQLRPLTTALIAEEKYVRQEQQSTARPAGPMTPESRAQQMEDSVSRQEESNRRYLEAAAPNMSSQQLALVRQTLEQQIAISRASARMQRQRLEAQQ